MLRNVCYANDRRRVARPFEQRNPERIVARKIGKRREKERTVSGETAGEDDNPS